MSGTADRLDLEMSGATVVVRGELDSFSAVQLSDSLAPRLLAGAVVLDLRAVTFIDSRGLAALLQVHRSAEESGGCVRMIAGRRVRRLFDLAGLDGYLHVDEG